MRITKWGEYGILCSLFLASSHDKDGTVGANDIAEAQLIPLQYTHQILQRLRKGDIITSTRGPKGGYRLSRNPEEINLKQVLEASEGATFEIICEHHPVYGEACGEEHTCGLNSVWRDLKSAIDELLEKKTLAQILTVHEFYPGKENLVQLTSNKSKEA